MKLRVSCIAAVGFILPLVSVGNPCPTGSDLVIGGSKIEIKGTLIKETIPADHDLGFSNGKPVPFNRVVLDHPLCLRSTEKDSYLADFEYLITLEILLNLSGPYYNLESIPHGARVEIYGTVDFPDLAAPWSMGRPKFKDVILFNVDGSAFAASCEFTVIYKSKMASDEHDYDTDKILDRNLVIDGKIGTLYKFYDWNSFDFLVDGQIFHVLGHGGGSHFKVFTEVTGPSKTIEVCGGISKSIINGH